MTLTTETASFVEKATVNISTGVITPTQSSTSMKLDLNNIAVTAGSTLYAWLAVAPTDLAGKTITAKLTTDDGTKYKADIAGKTLATGTAYILKGTVAAEGTGGTGGDIPFGGDDPVYTYVDLGLPSGTLWATCNVGAEAPEDYGDYFAWGETESQSDNSYSWKSYKWCNGLYYTLTKYCTDPYGGTVDNMTALDPEDDVAHVKWGCNWRMPTFDEKEELRTECTWTWTQVDGVNGSKVTGPNGNSIFLPAAGYRFEGSLVAVGSEGNYWVSSLRPNNPSNAYQLTFNSSNYVYWFDIDRSEGNSVRPVYDEKPQHEYVDLGLPSGILWATCNVGAENPEDYGDYFAWGETEPQSDNGYTWYSYKWCNGSSCTMTKYCTSLSYGTVDNKTVLDLADDAARANWGGSWRMPTFDEQEELRTECTWTWMTVNGVNGYKVSSNQQGNTNFIFLPAAGERADLFFNGVGSYCSYWSSSLSTSSSDGAYCVFFDSDWVDWRNYSRYIGQSVRPVCAE